MNIIEKHRTLFCSPPRQATRAIGAFLTRNYGLVGSKGKNSLEHTTHIPEGKEGYDIIMTVRNPYFRYLSTWSWQNNLYENKRVKKPTSQVVLKSLFHLSNWGDLPDKVSYWVRTECIGEDLLKVPFIQNDYQKGKIDPEAEFATNFYKSTYDPIWIEDLNENASLIYENQKWIFDKFGYDKDSYKLILE